MNILKQYESEYGLEKLSQIFLRFKPLFLCFKYRDGRKIINKIRRLAKIHHKPMPEDYLNSITSKLKSGNEINMDRLREELDKVNTFRKIRLLYSLQNRMSGDIKEDEI